MRHAVIAALLASFPLAGHSASVIDNGVVQLGVDTLGQLNVPGPASDLGITSVGLRYIAGGVSLESTANGCLCEGWGVGRGDTNQFGAASNDFPNSGGIQNLTGVSFASDATTATSVVDVNGAGLRVTHRYAPAAETSSLYRVTVTIENTSGAEIVDLRYTRTMDWDIDPTPFSEFVTIKGTGSTTLLGYSDDNGFSNANPFGNRGPIMAGTVNTDFTDFGSSDHGAHFDFLLGALADGGSYSFDTFYGAAANERAALAAIGAVGTELYSLGQSRCGIAACNDGVTFIFGFAGVGGTPVEPPNPNPVPLPASAVLLMGGLGLLGARRLARRA